jgi:hypothetical protein
MTTPAPASSGDTPAGCATSLRFGCGELVSVGKTELEFFDTETVPWTPVVRRPGVSERVLARDPENGLLTRLVRWDPGLDTSGDGPVTHQHFEEVLILSGSMRDLGLQRSFSAGSYASRPPGMVHGPWTTADGCVMLEIQYAG